MSDTELAGRLSSVDDRARAAAEAAGRDPEKITRIVVTKFHPVELITALRSLGVTDIAENRQQEFSQKIDEVATPETLTWHFVGQLQSNKARAIARAARTVPLVIHTLDRARLVTTLDRALADEGVSPVDALVQVNLTEDAGRGGAAPEDLESLAEAVAEATHLRLRGLMAVAPLGESASAAFDRVAELSERVRRIDPDAHWISAGMSGDFEQAIAAGATHLRIGSAITGNRPQRG